MTFHVVLSLGSNLGDSDALLNEALAGLTEQTRLSGVSPRARTAPVVGDIGPADQPDFLNQVVIVETELAPLDLLDLTQELERAAGRTREVRWGPRTLDIDLISYRAPDGEQWSELTLDTDRLTLPHPRAHERAFVLAPWSWLDPQATLGGRPVTELLAGCTDDVRRVDA